MFINHSSREVTAKVVYYGPGLSGKTSNLQYIFSVTNPKSRGELISIETEIERTLFFDLLPINVGLINGYQTKFQLYTVPGQVFYDSTRKLVLKGADGIVFVADSQELMRQSNLDSLENLKKNMQEHRLDIRDIPIVLQYNKRDLTNISSIEALNESLNKWNFLYYLAVAKRGDGVLETLRGISTLILKKIRALLEHTPGNDDKTSHITVDFSVNKKHKIIEKENLPLRKIQADNLESVTNKVETEEYGIKSDQSPPLEEPKPKDFEEDLKVETLPEDNDLRNIDDIFIDEDDSYLDDSFQSNPLKDLDEIKLDDDDKDIPNVNTSFNDNINNIGNDNYSNESIDKNHKDYKDTKDTKFEKKYDSQLGDLPPLIIPDEDTNELATKNTLDKPSEDQKDIEDEIEGVNSLEVDEFFENEPPAGNRSIEEKQENPPKGIEIKHEDKKTFEKNIPFISTHPHNPSKQTDNNQPPIEKDIKDIGIEKKNTRKNEDRFKELELIMKTKDEELKLSRKTRTNEPSEEIKEIEDLKKSLQEDHIPKRTARNITTNKGLDLFDTLNDKARITLIKEIPMTQQEFTIEIKDIDQNILESIQVQLMPETRKINLILDVKK